MSLRDDQAMHEFQYDLMDLYSSCCLGVNI